jgi:hypothetical protein
MIRAVEVTRNDGGKPRTKMSGNLRQLSVLDLPMARSIAGKAA